jgi:hypothetical protein
VPSLARALLGLWAVGTFAVGASVTALHTMPLPLPSAEAMPPAEGWRLVHALAAQCPCSMRIVRYLVERGAVAGVQETVLLVDGDDALAAPLRAAGFEVVLLDEGALAEHGFTSAPSLVVAAPDGTVAYRGAHAPKPGAPPSDREVLAEAVAGVARDPMAVLGCAVSRDLQDRLDPFNVKYALWR